VQKQQGEVGAFLFVVELSFLKGRERLAKSGPVESLITF
jgi:adenine/guanine phosphoribosyltransferase-like PRPP-binding protein